MGCGASRSEDASLSIQSVKGSRLNFYHNRLRDHQSLTFKVIMLGEMAVGKSSLNYQWQFNLFDPRAIQITQFADFSSKIMNIESHPVKLQIWDTAGQERFNAITRTYYQNCDACLIVYDITNIHSFERISYWLEDLTLHGPLDTIKLIVGNKTDLESSRQVSKQQVQSLCQQFNVKSVEATATDKESTHAIFDKLALMLVNKHKLPASPSI